MTFEELVKQLKKKKYNILTNYYYPIKKYTIDDLKETWEAGYDEGREDGVSEELQRNADIEGRC